jgi:hypothetical protein
MAGVDELIGVPPILSYGVPFSMRFSPTRLGWCDEPFLLTPRWWRSAVAVGNDSFSSSSLGSDERLLSWFSNDGGPRQSFLGSRLGLVHSVSV